MGSSLTAQVGAGDRETAQGGSVDTQAPPVLGRGCLAAPALWISEGGFQTRTLPTSGIPGESLQQRVGAPSKGGPVGRYPCGKASSSPDLTEVSQPLIRTTHLLRPAEPLTRAVCHLPNTIESSF